MHPRASAEHTVDDWSMALILPILYQSSHLYAVRILYEYIGTYILNGHFTVMNFFEFLLLASHWFRRRLWANDAENEQNG